jgi:hypothetical protein
MKIIKLTSVITLFTLCVVVLFFSCSSPEDLPGTDPTNEITSIMLSSSKTTLEEGQRVFFTVEANTQDDLTHKAEIIVNNSAINGNSYILPNSGNYIVKATYKELTSNELSITATEKIVVASVELTVSSTSIEVGGTSVFTLAGTLTDGSTVDLTGESTTKFFVNGVQVGGHRYVGLATGSFVVKATSDSITSEEITVQVSSLSIVTPQNFTQKAIIEDYTGTWCGWCPRVSYAISLVEDATDKVFAVGVHIGDGMENTYSLSLEAGFSVTGYPTAYVDRSSMWVYPEPNNVGQATDMAQGMTNSGLALNSMLQGTTLNVIVNTGFTQEKNNVKMVLFVLEDGIIANQSNYTSYYGGGSSLPNFEHNHVLRYAATDVLGDVTNGSVGVHQKIFNINLPLSILDKTKIGVLAMLVDSTGKVVYNAQYAPVDTEKEFD